MSDQQLWTPHGAQRKSRRAGGVRDAVWAIGQLLACGAVGLVGLIGIDWLVVEVKARQQQAHLRRIFSSQDHESVPMPRAHLDRG